MPIYEYLCKKCKRVYEIMHKHDEPINTEGGLKVVCDDCLEPLVKIISLSGFRLKGRGWAGATIKHGKNYYGEGLD